MYEIRQLTGPAIDSALPVPRKIPVPMVPPIAMNWRCRLDMLRWSSAPDDDDDDDGLHVASPPGFSASSDVPGVVAIATCTGPVASIVAGLAARSCRETDRQTDRRGCEGRESVLVTTMPLSFADQV